MKKHYLLIFSFLFLIIPSTIYGDSLNIWQLFIQNPNRENYEECKRQILESHSDKYINNEYGEYTNTPTQRELINDYKVFEEFLSLVEKQNVYAIELAFQIQSFTDGAIKEELYIKLGNLLKRKPNLFLMFVDKYNITDNDLESITLIYGDEFVDNIDKQINETNERIEACEKVGNAQLVEIKKKCIKILEKRKKILLKNKEFIYVAEKISSLLKDDPVSALRMIKEYNISNLVDLRGVLLWNLPSDNSRISMISKRINLIEQKIVESDLLELKKECLNILIREKNVLIKMKELAN